MNECIGQFVESATTYVLCGTSRVQGRTSPSSVSDPSLILSTIGIRTFVVSHAVHDKGTVRQECLAVLVTKQEFPYQIRVTDTFILGILLELSLLLVPTNLITF